MTTKKVITRFAPSPTGFMHVGNVRTALFAYLFAKKNRGDFILRIEDTDKEREVVGSIEHIIESLTWLGINWDKGITKDEGDNYIQSNRTSLYHEYALKLISAGYAYPDPYTQEQIDIWREDAKTNKIPFLYRNHRPDSFDEWKVGKPLRFKTPIKRYAWHDEVRGELTAGEESLDDFILIKSDGYPTYNFCHIIDDIEMNVTHVMRGQEFIASTPKFLALYEALQNTFPQKNIELPFFVTLPPILGESGGKKLGKRDGSKDILEYRTEGILPEALLNYLLLQGWNPGTEQECFTQSEMENIFTLEKIQKSGARWNEEKLLWFNKEHIKKLGDWERIEYCKMFIPKQFSYIVESKNFEKIVTLIIERIHNGKGIEELFKTNEFSYLFETPVISSKEILFWKNCKEASLTRERLNKVYSVICNINSPLLENPEEIKNILWPLTEEEGRGEILWPLRVALSGLEKSLDPFIIISLLEKEEVLKRVKNAINLLQ